MTKLTEQEMRNRMEEIHRRQMERPSLRPNQANQPWEQQEQQPSDHVREFARMPAFA